MDSERAINEGGAGVYRFEIFRNWQGGFRWRILTANGRILATSELSFSTAEIAARSVREILPELGRATVHIDRQAA